MTNEIRQNKVTRQWVIYAPERGERPRDFGRGESREQRLPIRDETCPFCPGNEHMLPEIIAELPASDSDQWQTRIVPNKFPALSPNTSTERRCEGIYVAMPGHGNHEVLIEHPRHNIDIATMTLAEVETIIETYHRRYIDLMSVRDNMMAIIFRNRGVRAGTSLMHPHSQVVVTGIVPQTIRWREDEAQRYFDQWGRCVFCDMLAYEAGERQRVIFENETFRAFVPFAAEVPCETWIVPRRHQADFGAISDTEKGDLAAALREILTRLHNRLNDPDYNYIINTAAQHRAGEPQLHWYLQIRPRLVTPAGFEIGSGMSVNPSLPEDDAALLR